MVRATVYQPQVQVLLVKNVDRTTAGDGVPLSARYQGADRVIDLTPWLSDASGIRTSKSVRDPAGGFSLTLDDRVHGKDLDSLYGLIEPMDCVEIRMARRGEVKIANGGKLPIVMRGFISDVRRPEGVAGAGKPQRQVIITGQDYGKLWQIFQIFYEKNFPVGATLISNWKLFLKFGMGFKNQSCRDFVKDAVQKILNEFIKNMKGKNESGKPAGETYDQKKARLEDDIKKLEADGWAKVEVVKGHNKAASDYAQQMNAAQSAGDTAGADAARESGKAELEKAKAAQTELNEIIAQQKAKKREIAQLKPDQLDLGSPLQEIKIDDKDITAAPGTVAPTGVNQFQGGTLYSMLNSFGDVGPWNELFLEDREAGVFLVYRPNPFYAVNGDYLPVKRFDNKDAKEPARAVVEASDIVAINVARTDGNVANYFWVDAPRSQMTNGSTAKLMAVQGAPDTFLIDHRNATQSIYGLRKMFDVTNQGDPLEETHGNGADKETHDKQYSLTAGWINKRRIEIVEQNKDNVVFESGSLRIKGREDIRPGMYVDVVRGSMEYGFYVVQVDQEFIPFQGFFTTLTVERGTGFIKRAQREGARQSPYFAELSSRV